MAGFANVMPTFKGQLQEDQLVALVALYKVDRPATRR